MKKLTDAVFDDKVLVVSMLTWEESESGWGTRPDGHSLHVNHDEARKYVKEYWVSMPSAPAPHEYSRPLSDNPVGVRVDETLYNMIKEKGSLRFWHGDIRMLTDTTGARQIVQYAIAVKEDEPVVVSTRIEISEVNWKNGHSIKLGTGSRNLKLTFDPKTEELISAEVIKG